jgi:hypothetical protein
MLNTITMEQNMLASLAMLIVRPVSEAVNMNVILARPDFISGMSHSSAFHSAQLLSRRLVILVWQTTLITL